MSDEARTSWFEFLRSVAKQRLLEGVLTCNLKFGECCVMNKKTKVKFRITTHRSEDFLDCIHVDVWGPTKTASLEGHQCFVSFVDDLSRRC